MDRDTILNLAHLGELARVQSPDGSTLRDRMIGHFVDASPGHVARLRQAGADRDLAAVAQTAHKLTGESATVGALVVGRLAREIELLVDAGTVADLDRRIRALTEAVAVATTALLEYQADRCDRPSA